MTLSITIPKTISLFGKQLISGKDLGFKLARIGIGSTIVGAGVSAGINSASTGITESGKTISEGFGIDKTLLFVVGAVLLILLLVGLKGK
jgi:hypothetical protein